MQWHKQPLTRGKPEGRQSIGGGVNPRECTDIRLAPAGRHKIVGARKSLSDITNLSPRWGCTELRYKTHAPGMVSYLDQQYC